MLLVRLSALLLAPLLVSGYDPGAEWIPGMKGNIPTVPPLPPRNPDAEVIRPIIDPRPIIDGNFPVDRNHRFSSFFVNDKPRLPENYDRELAAQGLTPEERRFGEDFVGVQKPVHRGSFYPSRLSQREHFYREEQHPPVHEHTESYVSGRLPALAASRPHQRVQEPVDLPPSRPPLPLSYRRPPVPRVARPGSVFIPTGPAVPEEIQAARGSGTIRLQNGYSLQLVPVSGSRQRQTGPERVPSPSRAQFRRRTPSDVQRVNPVAPNPNRDRRLRFPSHIREQRQSEEHAYQHEGGNHLDVENRLPEQLPEWPDVADPAAIDRYHQQMRERMDRIMNRSTTSETPRHPSDFAAPPPISERTRPRSSPSGQEHEVLVEHHESRSDEPYMRESYKVYKLPNGHRTTYSRHTSTTTTTQQRRRPARVAPLRRTRRSWLSDASSWFSETLSKAEEKGRQAATAAGDALATAGGAISDVASQAGDALTGTASAAYERGSQVASDAGDLLSQAPEVASRAGSAIYDTAEEAYQTAVNSDTAQAVSAQVDNVLAEVDTSSAVDSLNQAGLAVSRTASEVAEGVSDAASSAGESLAARFGSTSSEEVAEGVSNAASSAGESLAARFSSSSSEEVSEAGDAVPVV